MTYQPNFKIPRIRCEAHLKWIRQKPCMICGNFATAHHLTIGPEGKARGLTAGDNWTLPLCSQHHLAGFPGSLHHDGDERRWWAAHGIDPIAAAQQLWQESQAHRSGHAMPQPETTAADCGCLRCASARTLDRTDTADLP